MPATADSETQGLRLRRLEVTYFRAIGVEQLQQAHSLHRLKTVRFGK